VAAAAWVVAGLITALILMCCGVDAQDIITNYHQSEIFLSPVMDRITAENQAKGLNAGFDGTPPEVMEQTIGYIFEKWGSITGTTQHAHTRTRAQAAQHADQLTLAHYHQGIFRILDLEVVTRYVSFASASSFWHSSTHPLASPWLPQMKLVQHLAHNSRK
jgi:hypothetical protein